MSIYGKINPTWDIESIKKLDFKLDPDPDVCKEYSQAGHNLDSIKIYNCFEYDIDFDLEFIKENFNFLKNISIAINLFKPGQYIPLHNDRYERYRKYHQLSNNSSILRTIIMLEDSCEGQLLQIEELVVGRWTAGCWYGWKNTDRHAFYNMSKTNRYAIQLTGTLD